jgi:hypothetical protein
MRRRPTRFRGGACGVYPSEHPHLAGRSPFPEPYPRAVFPARKLHGARVWSERCPRSTSGFYSRRDSRGLCPLQLSWASVLRGSSPAPAATVSRRVPLHASPHATLSAHTRLRSEVCSAPDLASSHEAARLHGLSSPCARLRLFAARERPWLILSPSRVPPPFGGFLDSSGRPRNDRSSAGARFRCATV